MDKKAFGEATHEEKPLQLEL